MRLTKKDLMNAIDQPMCFGSRLVGKKMFAQIIKELCEYKDIEEELGIDLITLFKAKNKCFCKINDKVYEGYIDEIYLTQKQIGFANDDNDLFELFISDYGKTWALTKEELQ